MRYTLVMLQDFRAVIKRELERRGWSAYRLGKESGLPIRTVQAYVAGQCDLMAERVAAMCDALGLELGPKRRQKGK